VCAPSETTTNPENVPAEIDSYIYSAFRNLLVYGNIRVDRSLSSIPPEIIRTEKDETIDDKYVHKGFFGAK
jgi:hypothetical protein